MSLSRRDLLRLGFASTSGSLLAGCGKFIPLGPTLSKSSKPSDPHFFLAVVLNGGADPSYMFDARPLSMTSAGKIHNYLGQEPTAWTGTNGTSCLATHLVDPLKKYRDYFSIVNGVIMSQSFNGHTQNMSYLFTGNTFGGESFIPHLNSPEVGRVPANIDALQKGSFPALISNGGSTIGIDEESAMVFKKHLDNLKPANGGDELVDFIKSRYTKLSDFEAGRFSIAVRKMLGGINSSPDLQEKLASMQIKRGGDFADLICSYFTSGISRSAIFVLPEQFDTHVASDAKTQPKLFSSAVNQISSLFKTLLETPFDAKQSMFDVTTIAVVSEFGRTMRIEGEPIDNTGTNHNQLTNSILLAGKGIKGGLVLGASDFKSADELLSKAHISLDPKSEMMMGQPFDFSSMMPAEEKPEIFDAARYLTIGSVINTIYSLFDVPKTRFRRVDRNNIIAPLLSSILKA